MAGEPLEEENNIVMHVCLGCLVSEQEVLYIEWEWIIFTMLA